MFSRDNALLWFALALVVLSLSGNVVLWVFTRYAKRIKPPALAGAVSGSLAVVFLLMGMLYGTERRAAMLLYLGSMALVMASNALIYFALARKGPSGRQVEGPERAD